MLRVPAWRFRCTAPAPPTMSRPSAVPTGQVERLLTSGSTQELLTKPPAAGVYAFIRRFSGSKRAGPAATVTG